MGAKSEQLRADIRTVVESFGTQSFKSCDVTNNKIVYITAGSWSRYKDTLLENGSIIVDSINGRTKNFKVVNPLNFNTQEHLKQKSTGIKKRRKLLKNSITSKILKVCPNGPFSKNDVWSLLNDSSINKDSFMTTFSTLVRKGYLVRTEKKGYYKLPFVEKSVKTQNDNPSIKVECFNCISSYGDEDVFSTHDLTDSLKKLFPTIEEKSVRTPMTRFMKLGVIDRVGKNEYKKNLDYDFNVLPGHPETVVASYSKNFNPKECSNKYAIAKLQYTKVAKYVEGDVLVFSGPNVKKHVAATKSITKGKHKLHLIDKNPIVFKHILSKINNLDDNVNLIFSNVMDIRINAQFQDLDFCSSWIGKESDEYDPGEITSVRLMEQAEKGYPVSALSFTFSKRGMNNIDTVKAINNIIHCLGASVKSFDGVNRSYGEGEKVLTQVKSKGNLKYAKKHFPIFRLKGRIIELEFYTYKDTSHMMTCLVIYK